MLDRREGPLRGAALDRGDIAELVAEYEALGSLVDRRVVGGCCGTDDERIGAMRDEQIDELPARVQREFADQAEQDVRNALPPRR